MYRVYVQTLIVSNAVGQYMYAHRGKYVVHYVVHSSARHTSKRSGLLTALTVTEKNNNLGPNRSFPGKLDFDTGELKSCWQGHELFWQYG